MACKYSCEVERRCRYAVPSSQDWANARATLGKELTAEPSRNNKNYYKCSQKQEVSCFAIDPVVSSNPALANYPHVQQTSLYVNARFEWPKSYFISEKTNVLYFGLGVPLLNLVPLRAYLAREERPFHG